MRIRDLGPLRLVELVTAAGAPLRSALPADPALWQLDVVADGTVLVEDGGSKTVLGATDLALTDPPRTARFAGVAATSVAVLIPRQSLALAPDDAVRLTGMRIRGDRGTASLVSALVRHMVRSLTGFRAGEADRAAAAVIELIAVTLSAQLDDARSASDDALRARIVSHIEARLPDRALTPATVARIHHLSLRRLHKLFEHQPLTVAALIRTRRLERCHAELVWTEDTVAAVAARWGFADPAHFSRLFKATYGYTAATLTARNRARIVNAHEGAPGQNDG